ncbi:conserved hypothetical protein [Vibrio chagasii]|uniref:hypothetical protein n=1 Tax=Vibrio splendidus TaxID=29497 RepID=UPI000E3257D6|nr:hypothetical protein [Vibrio splendidus]CAH6807824.1 conserved hypothetical protein [Vibrio chagasii]CAH6970983.1 conserved hypothetical protein [Vibrio chagasii]CAH6993566.1 conserved hypothetical protein [Vibrio chagasii]
MIRALLNFVRNPQNEPISSWVQTLLLAIGVVYGLVQLTYISDSYTQKLNENYLKHYEHYNKAVFAKLTELSNFYFYLKDDESSVKRIAQQFEDILQKEDEVDQFFNDISSCAKFGLCPQDKVDSLVCGDVSQLHADITKVMPQLIQYGSHKFQRIPSNYERLINSHCGFFDRVYHWYLRNV